MKRFGTFLLLIALAGVGCMPLRVDDQQKLPTKPKPQTEPQAPPVMVEDVNENNPEEAARRLEAELKSEAQKD